MGFKIGLLLSMTFVFSIFALGGDIVSLQLIYTEMDSVAMTAGYLLSKSGNILKAEQYVNKNGMIFTCENYSSPLIGDTLDYTVSKKFKPLVMKKDEMNLAIKRSVVIGYYY